ncbi:hypothetical protein HDF18_08480 [Mucilaginibacter sp. X5P1]|uniref:hypothetical protein n=1 Tax=Mucilaginibacter sp. X5P1 TaxID=2723088 RepID=UPI0016213B28|nr:hypothetical protein [Mucilaginibacter sp. X5P1]MBB6137693.1 hypothetical protein [Mucilaginibacter sp. X5P1]
MADPIGPVTDAYIDGIIKASDTYDPNLSLTQGIQLRALIKLLRDRLEQEVAGAAAQVHYKGTYISATALSAANPTANPGDYAFVDPGAGEDARLYIWDEDNVVWILSSGTGDIAQATETNAGIMAIATISQALAGTDNASAMTALKTLSVILDQKKNVNYQIAPVSLNEVSVLMLNAGSVNGITISGANGAKLKIGLTGSYPTGTQTFPLSYAAGDRVFVSFSYTDPNNATCNLILTCRDN